MKSLFIPFSITILLVLLYFISGLTLILIKCTSLYDAFMVFILLDAYMSFFSGIMILTIYSRFIDLLETF